MEEGNKTITDLNYKTTMERNKVLEQTNRILLQKIVRASPRELIFDLKCMAAAYIANFIGLYWFYMTCLRYY